MSSINIKKFRQLIEKYLNGSATPDEIDLIEKYYEFFADKPDQTDQLSIEQLTAMQKRMKGTIDQTLRRKSTPVLPISRPMYFRLAAAIVLLLGLLTILFQYDQPKVDRVAHKVEITNNIKPSTPKNRFAKLPDGSRVVLPVGSTLTFDKHFNTHHRVVNLTGEAYFDVVHQYSNGKNRKPFPFVINTGKIKTTVLGTAFSIKALPNKQAVVITVTRGKVRVDDGSKRATFLTADQQAIYRLDDLSLKQRVVESRKVTAWVQADMVFDETPFGELASTLEKRYGTSITFQNPELKTCLITGRFSGTETLEEVFTILSLTSHTKYILDGNQLIISGTNCF